MIFVHDKGRMANNMLQYGHVYAWGREHGRATMSMRFAYKYPWFHICHTRHHHLANYLFAKYAAKWGLIPTVRFDTEGADYSREEQMMRDRRLILVGGWYARWYDLFLKYKPEILQLFAFDKAVEEKAANILDVTADESQASPVSIRLGVHIRRGDYATFQGGRFLYSDEQYVAVIRQFCALHREATVAVYICTNDPKLDKAYYLKSLADCHVVFPAGNPAEDLCLLSHCHYLIGAPSTFTLVAAMYHDTPLYWIENPKAAIAFSTFDDLFRHIY